MVAKTMILSKIWYRSYFELPNDQQMKTLKNDFWKFIYGKATTSRINYKTCFSKPEHGGFKAFDIEKKMRANLCFWKKKLNEEHPWSYLLKQHIENNFDSKRIRDIKASWNMLQTVEDEEKISIIGTKKKSYRFRKSYFKRYLPEYYDR